VTLVLAPTVALPAPAHAQIFKRLKRAAKNAVENEAANQVDRLISNAMKCVFDDPLCAQKAKDSGQDVVYTDDDGNVLTDKDGKPITDADKAADAAAATGDQTLAPNTGVWANYDFVPGERVLFYDDYSGDNVGDFPRHLTFLKGNWELVEWRGRRLLRNTGPRGAAIEVPLSDTLPSRFTIEFDVYFTHGNQTLVVGAEPPPSRGDNYRRIPDNVFQVGVNTDRTGVLSNTKGGVQALNETKEVGQKIVPFRIMVDGRYAKVYVGSRRVANVPNAEIHRGTALYIENSYFANAEHPMYLGPIRVAAGGRSLYDVLAEKGRVATHGILFAVNSARIRPESTPTLEEIAKMLRDHADLRLSIEGHTDSTGDADYNQDLSERRAGAVRDYLTEQDGIDPSRLETTGYGETKSVADNGTPEGRQQNRRVELVKLSADGASDGAGEGTPPASTPGPSAARAGASPASTDPVSATSARSPGGRKAIAYRVHLAMGGDTVSFSAVTGAGLSAFLDASGQPTQLAGDAVGGTPVTPLPIGLLQDAWVRLPEPPPTLLDASPIGDISNAATLDSVHIDLSDAGSGPAIDGHPTRHMRLRVETFSVAVDTSGRKTPFRGAGRSDLWFASDLPFSWLPLGGSNGPIPEAIPLAHSIPAAGTYVADALAPRLRKLGLLLRADVRDSILLKDRPGAGPGWGSDFTIVRKIWVDSIGPATTVPPAGRYADMQHISELRMRLAAAVAMMTTQECGAMAGRTGGSFDLTVTGPPSTRLSGRAFSLPPETGRMTAPAHLILEAGKAAGPATTCLWISLPKGAVRTGSFPLSAAAGSDPDPSAARAFEIVMTPGGGDPRAMGLVETGTLQIRSAHGGSVAGALKGTGWRLDVDPAQSPPKGTLRDDLGFELKFEAVQAAPDSEGAAGSAPGPARPR